MELDMDDWFGVFGQEVVYPFGPCMPGGGFFPSCCRDAGAVLHMVEVIADLLCQLITFGKACHVCFFREHTQYLVGPFVQHKATAGGDVKRATRDAVARR